MKSQGQNKNLIIGLLILLWLLSVFTAYMVTHKPFTPEQFLRLSLSLWRIIVPGLLVALAGGLGLFARVDNLSQPPLTTAALAAAFGFGVIAIYALLWGSLIGVNGSILILPGLALILLRKRIMRWLALWQIKIYWAEGGWVGKFIIVSIAILLFCRLFMALSPPLEFDALTYHFAIPKAYLQVGKIHYISDLMFWGMPELTEMLYMLTMLLGGVQAAAVLSWIFGVLALAGIADFCKSIFGSDSALLAVGSLLSGTALVISLGSGYIEWISILYGLAMLVCILKWHETNERFALVLAGIFAGMALSTKYTSGIALLAGLLIILLLAKPLKHRLSAAITFGLCATLLFIPWLVKNYLGTGSPFYPLLIPTADFDAIRMTAYNVAPLKQDWSRIILLPWLATVMGVDAGKGYSASIGPLLLSFSPLAYVFWDKMNTQKRGVILVSTIALGLGMIIWVVASQFSELLIQTRLYMTVFPEWALLAAAGFGALRELKAADIRFGNIAAILIVVAMSFVVYETVLSTSSSGAINVALGARTEDRYLETNVGEFKNAVDAMEALPKGSRVLMLWETRGFYCQPICDSDEIIDRWYHDWRTTGDIDAVIAQWRAEGYTHVLLRVDGMNFIRTEDKVTPYLPSDWQALDELLTHLQVVEKFGQAFILYSLEK